MNPPPDSRLHTLFPCLDGLSAELTVELGRQALPLQAPAGTLLFDDGQACQALPLVLEGSIRVAKRSEGGREIGLYRVRPGEVCLVTASCLLGGAAYPATAVTALALPRPLFIRLVEAHAPFRDVVFALFADRLTALMQLVEEVAFRKLDQRLAALLVARGPVLAASHQVLADELGSVREIVSRLLKQFEEQGWVRLGRERIEVLKVEALSALASGGAV